jgi:pilus assembly protein FimV
MWGAAKEAASLAPDLKLDFGDAMTAPPPAMKLTGINLNLDEIMPAQSEGSGKDEQWSDMQTKFDLAKAYQEMGDKDGAREVLKDVIKQGDATQQEEAKKLLESLG